MFPPSGVVDHKAMEHVWFDYSLIERYSLNTPRSCVRCVGFMSRFINKDPSRSFSYFLLGFRSFVIIILEKGQFIVTVVNFKH
jgi:hypothetical protein